MTIRRVRVRLLPWRPRWRTGEVVDTPDLPFDDLGDDPISAVIGLVLLVVFLPFLLLFVVGVVLLGTELLLLLALLPLLLLVQVLGLRPWVLVLTDPQGVKTGVPVAGTRRMLAERRRYRALRA